MGGSAFQQFENGPACDPAEKTAEGGEADASDKILGQTFGHALEGDVGDAKRDGNIETMQMSLLSFMRWAVMPAKSI